MATVSTTVPVHIDATRSLVMAECARCGRKAECAVRHSDGGPVARRKAATRRALAELTAACELQLPWGVAPAHAERGIPRGLSLYAEDVHGKLWELSVNERGKLETVVGGCDFAAAVVVVPETGKLKGAAVEFAAKLVGRGYARARAERVGYAGRRTQGAQS